MEYYLSSLGQSSQPVLAARSCQGTGYLVGSEGQTGSLLPTRSEWGSRQAIATVAAAGNNIQRATGLKFEEGGWNSSEPILHQESAGMEGGRVVAPQPPPPPPPHPSLAIYPERPGVQDCPFYLRTGTCGFGQQCKFNHPPNGRASVGYQSFSTRGKVEYPERLGQPECQYYMKTGTCKFGATCKYHHPSLKFPSNSPAYQPPRPPLNSLGYPLRPGEKECAYYMRNRLCKFGVTCRFHHPQLPPTNGAGLVQPRPGALPHPLVNSTPPHLPFPIPQPWPMRSMPTRFQVYPHQQVQYLSQPSGAHVGGGGVGAAPSSSPPHVFSQHPHQQGGPRPPQHANANPSQQHSVPAPPYFYTTPGGPGSGAGAGSLAESNAAGGSGGGMATAVPPYYAGHGTHFMSSVPCGPMGMGAQAGGGPTAATGQQGGAGVGGMVYLQQAREFPERPGQPECTFYMRTGDCKYGMSCRYHHPKDRGVPAAQCALSSMGLPLRPGQPQCSFYTRYGVCKFGHTCKFDHPVGLDYSPSASSLVDLPVAPVSYTGGTSPLGNQSGDGRNGEEGEMASSTAQERQHQQQLLMGDSNEREKQEEDASSQGEDMGGKKTSGGSSAIMADGGEAGGPSAASAAAQANASAMAGVVSGLGGSSGTHQSGGGGMYCSAMTAQTGGNGSVSATG